MADDNVIPPTAPVAPPVTDPAPAPSDTSPPPAGTTLLTQGDTPPPADPAKTPDPKTLETKPTETKPAVVVPEKYEFKPVEGFDLNQGLVDAVSPVFKELGLTQEQASKLVDAYSAFGAKHAKEMEEANEKAFQQEMKDRADAHTAAIKKEWGGEYAANLTLARKGLARLFPGTEGKEMLDATGMGNHPEFLRAFLAVGKMIQEDKPPNGQQPTVRKSNEEVFYPNSH